MSQSILLCLLGLSLIFTGIRDISLGGELGLHLDADLYNKEFQAPGFNAAGKAALRAEGGLSWLNLIIEQSVELDKGLLVWQDWLTMLEKGLKEASIEFYPFDFMSIQLGRFNYSPGKALFLSPSNFLRSLNWEALVKGDQESMYYNRDLIQISVYLDKWYFKGSCAPFHKQSLLPKPEDPWFPDKDIPQSRKISSLTLELDEFNIYQSNQPLFDIHDLSWEVEVGATFNYLDLALLFFHGLDKDMLYTITVGSAPLTDPLHYDIALYQKTRKATALALNLSSSFSGFKIWTDNALYFDKYFPNIDYKTLNQETTLNKSPAADLCLGASWRGTPVDLNIILEGRALIPFQGWEKADSVFLNPILSAIIKASFIDFKLTPAIMALISLDEPGFCLWPSISWKWQLEHEIQIKAPIFLGKSNTDLGQFSDKHHIFLEYRYRF